MNIQCHACKREFNAQHNVWVRAVTRGHETFVELNFICNNIECGRHHVALVPLADLNSGGRAVAAAPPTPCGKSLRAEQQLSPTEEIA